jgi:hypothetical protein
MQATDNASVIPIHFRPLRLAGLHGPNFLGKKRLTTGLPDRDSALKVGELSCLAALS